MALTRKVSPTTARAGRRPPSTAGATSSTGIRPIIGVLSLGFVRAVLRVPPPDFDGVSRGCDGASADRVAVLRVAVLRGVVVRGVVVRRRAGGAAGSAAGGATGSAMAGIGSAGSPKGSNPSDTSAD
ncbi:hypothetical protein GCM10009738_48890 [Kitasatospora viridis]